MRFEGDPKLFLTFVLPETIDRDDEKNDEAGRSECVRACVRALFPRFAKRNKKSLAKMIFTVYPPPLLLPPSPSLEKRRFDFYRMFMLIALWFNLARSVQTEDLGQ